MMELLNSIVTLAADEVAGASAAPSAPAGLGAAPTLKVLTVLISIFSGNELVERMNDRSGAAPPRNIAFRAAGSKPVILLSFKTKSVTSINELLPFLPLDFTSITITIGSMVELRTAFAMASEESDTATLVITRRYNFSSDAFSKETIMLFTNSPPNMGLPVGTLDRRVVKR